MRDSRPATTRPAARRRDASRERFERLLGTIRERICLLHYPPGTPLNETALAEELGVSRTPLRRVLQRLNYEGLVETRNGVGNLVTDFDLEQLLDLYAFRLRLTELMGELDPRPAGSGDLAALDALSERALRLRRARDQEEYARVCNAFEALLEGLIGNPALRETTALYYYRTARLWVKLISELNWDEELDALVREIEETRATLAIGDARGVGFVRRRYLFRLMTQMRRNLQACPTPEGACETPPRAALRDRARAGRESAP